MGYLYLVWVRCVGLYLHMQADYGLWKRLMRQQPKAVCALVIREEGGYGCYVDISFRQKADGRACTSKNRTHLSYWSLLLQLLLLLWRWCIVAMPPRLEPHVEQLGQPCQRD